MNYPTAAYLVAFAQLYSYAQESRKQAVCDHFELVSILSSFLVLLGTLSEFCLFSLILVVFAFGRQQSCLPKA
jgi:hypothetical protein